MVLSQKYTDSIYRNFIIYRDLYTVFFSNLILQSSYYGFDIDIDIEMNKLEFNFAQGICVIQGSFSLLFDHVYGLKFKLPGQWHEANRLHYLFDYGAE